MKLRNTVTILAILSLTIAANAAIVQTSENSGVVSETDPIVSTYAGDISAVDLINAGQPSLSSTAVDGYQSPAGLNDGADGLAWGGFDAPNSVDFLLDTAASPDGYNVDTIVVFAGDNRVNKADLEFSIEYQSVGSSDWTTLGTWDYETGLSTADGMTAFSKVTLADDQGAAIMTGIQAVRFIATRNGPDAHFRELDVFGAAVPEPTTMGLVALGALGLLRRRR